MYCVERLALHLICMFESYTALHMNHISEIISQKLLSRSGDSRIFMRYPEKGSSEWETFDVAGFGSMGGGYRVRIPTRYAPKLRSKPREYVHVRIRKLDSGTPQ